MRHVILHFLLLCFRHSTEVLCGCADKLWRLNYLSVYSVQTDVGYCLIVTSVCSFIPLRDMTCSGIIIMWYFSIGHFILCLIRRLSDRFQLNSSAVRLHWASRSTLNSDNYRKQTQHVVYFGLRQHFFFFFFLYNTCKMLNWSIEPKDRSVELFWIINSGCNTHIVLK